MPTRPVLPPVSLGVRELVAMLVPKMRVLLAGAIQSARFAERRSVQFRHAPQEHLPRPGTRMRLMTFGTSWRPLALRLPADVHRHRRRQSPFLLHTRVLTLALWLSSSA